MPLNKKQEASDTLPDASFLSVHNSARVSARLPIHDLCAIIAGAGGAAHLAGVVAAFTTLPVIGVPVKSRSLEGLDSLLSMVQMPPGIPVATVGIDGARNAALLAIEIMAVTDPAMKLKLDEFRAEQARKVLESEI